MAEFWDLIVRSNTFNFLIMLIIFAILWQKLNVSTILEKMKLEIADFIENSQTEREKSKQYLLDTKISVANLDKEIQEKLALAKLSAQNVFDEIQEMAQKNVQKIETNVDKIIYNEERKVTTTLSQNTAQEAVNLAFKKLKQIFANTPELHQKYLDEQIETLDRIEI